MAGSPNHRSEHTGNPALDRVQNNVRDLIQFAKQLLARVVTMESGHGLPKLATVACPDRDFALTSEQYAAGAWLFTGTLSAARTVTVPRPISPNAYFRWAFNNTSGGFDLTLKTDDGSHLVGNGTGDHVIVTREYGPEAWF